MKISKMSLLQGVAIAALSCAMAHQAIAAEAASTVDETADSSMLEIARAAERLSEATRVAQATPAAPASAPVQVAQAMPMATTPVVEAEGDPEAIVVTAFRRETFLQDTPISLGVINTDEIEKRHVQSLHDLADGAIPSLRIATYESRQTALTIGIRGIVPGDANQPAREQGVGIYIDGVYLGRQHGLNSALFDVERIEVLKGPQGTLFGRNTEGGALSIVTRAPSGEFGGRIVAGAGAFGSYNSALHLDLPEYANISIKIDAVIDHQDATTSNPLPSELGWNYHHRYGARLAARWTPAPNFTADLAVDTANDENTPFYSQLLNFNPNGFPVATLEEIAAAGNKLPPGKIAPLPPIVFVSGDHRMSDGDIGVPQQASIDKTEGVMAALNWQPADNLEIRSITAWRSVDSEQWDNSGGAHRSPAFLPLANFSRYSLSFLQQHQFSQELQAVGSLPQIDYIFGLYYFNEHAGEIASTPNTNKWNADGTAYTINDPKPWNPAFWSISRATRARSESYAAYGQATWTPASLETVHLTGGLRYTRDKKDGVLYMVNNVASNFPFEFEGDRVDPLAIVAWDATPDVNLYAKFSTGYRAGGASSRSLTFASFGPESVNAYEIGAKTELFDNLIRLNLAGYIMDRKDSQFDFDFYIVQPNGTVRHTLETVNADGTTKIRGIEADLTVFATDRLTLATSYAYTYWTVPPTPNPLVEGNPLQPLFIVYTPRHAFSSSIDYDLPLSGSSDMALRFHIDGNYSSSAYSFDNENVKADPSFIVNASVALADIPMGSFGQTMTVSLWARNLFDVDYIYRRSNANRVPIDGNFLTVLGDYANFNPPRTFGVEASVTF
jgi:iron complex outermembrane recepter protein